MKNKRLVNILFLFPVVFTFIMIIIVPFCYGIYYSMSDWNGVSPDIHFVGFKQYVKLFNMPNFLYSMIITVLFTVINVVLVNIVSFLLSLIVTSNLKLRNFYRAGFFVPYLIGGLVLGYIWQFLFNNVFITIGENMSIGFLQTSFLSHPDSVIWAMSVVNTWQYSGYLMLIYVASIQSIPASLMEAAQVDGARYFSRVVHILIPMMANAFTISLFLTLTTSFKLYDMNFALTNGGPATRFMGEPINASQLLAMNIVKTANANRMAEAQAKAVILFVALVVVALIQVSLNKKREVEL